MTVWEELLNNQVFVSAVVSWVTAQVLKTIVDYALNQNFSAERLVGAGGMPSSHSATVCALVTSCLLKHGPGSSEFAIAFGLAAIVMYDAIGVRRETGKHSLWLNTMISEFPAKFNAEIFQQKLKEYVGHTPLQVLAGAILGILITLLLDLAY